MPNTYKIVVFLNAVEGKDDAMNDWYSNRHMPAALEIPGFVRGQRYKITEQQRPNAKPQWKYLAIYDIETDDLQSVIDELTRREGTPMLVGTDTVAPGGFVNFFEPITDVMVGTKGTVAER